VLAGAEDTEVAVPAEQRFDEGAEVKEALPAEPQAPAVVQLVMVMPRAV
jgi:hypothetical protein